MRGPRFIFILIIFIMPLLISCVQKKPKAGGPKMSAPRAAAKAPPAQVVDKDVQVDFDTPIDAPSAQ